MKGGDASQSHYSAQQVRSALLAFLIGKGASAALTFMLFLVLVQLLTVTQYAAYVLGVAVMELSLAVGTFGLDWVASTWIPVFRVRAGSKEARRFILRLGGIQALAYVLVATALYAVAPLVMSLTGSILSVNLVHVIALLVVVEGCGRLLRDQMLGLLMRQGSAQLAQVLRSGGALLLVAVASLDPSRSLDALRVVQIESVAATIALAAAGISLLRHFRSEAATGPDGAWRRPSTKPMFSLAFHAHLSYLLSLAYGPQVMTALIAHVAGPGATALYGFCRTFADQVRRYLPAELLIGLLRPVLVARYAATGDFGALAGAGVRLVTFSIVALGGVLAVFWGLGDLLVNQMSANRYPDAWPVMLGLLFALVPFSARRVLETIANTVQLSRLCVAASLVLCLAPMIAILVLNHGGGAIGVTVVVFMAECLFVAVMLLGLTRAGMRIDIGAVRLVKIMAAVSAAGSIGFVAHGYAWWDRGGRAVVPFVLVVCTYLLVLWVTGAVRRADIDLIRQMVKPSGRAIPQRSL